MNDPLSLPASPASTPARKASWIHIAFICGVVVLVFGLAYLWVIGQFISRAGRAASELSASPAATTAELIVKENPDWQVIRADDKRREITLHNKVTREETTISYQDSASGNFSMKGSDGSKMEMKGGKIVISNANGEKTVLSSGSASPPAWIPAYPHVVRRDVSLSSLKDGRASGSLSFSTSDTPLQVKEYFTEALVTQGWNVVDATQIGKDAARLLMLKMELGEGEGKESFNVMASRKEDNDTTTTVQIIWEGTKKVASRS